jgi:hypothetical protein
LKLNALARKPKSALGFIFSFSPSEPLRRVDSQPGQLAYVDGGGFIRVVFGLPFLALGLFLVAMNARLGANVWADPPNGWHWLGVVAGFVILLVNCAMFTAFGGWLVFGRRGFVFDTETKIVTLWYSLPFLRRSAQYELGDYQAVSVAPSGVSFRTGATFSILLCGREVAPLVVVSLCVPRARADSLANEIARFLEWSGIENGPGSNGPGSNGREQKMTERSP